MDSIQIYLITAAVFLLGGAVKGTVGFGLPLVSITLLTPFYGLVDAIGLMVIPAVVTNFWQALAGGNFRVSWRRLWTLYVFGAVVTAISATILLQIHSRWPMVLLGGVIIVYSISGLAAWRYRPPGKKERWLSPLMGISTGFFTGLTGVLVFPMTIYLKSLRLDRSMMIQAMGIYLVLANLTVASVFGWQGAFPKETSVVAVIGVVAGLVGMVVGRWIQQRLSDLVFERVFYLALGSVGLFIILKALISE